MAQLSALGSCRPMFEGKSKRGLQFGVLLSISLGVSLHTFAFPTTTLFGAGAVAELKARSQGLGIRRPLVVTDSGLLETAAFRALTKALGVTGQWKHWFVFSGVHSNPIE